MPGAKYGRIINFPVERSMRDTKNKLYQRLTISLNSDEQVALEALSFVEDIGTSTLARQFFLRGLEAFLKDHRLSPILGDDQIRAALGKLLDSNKDLAVAKGIIEKRHENGKRTKRTS